MIKNDFGFIRSDELPDEKIYFRLASFHGKSPISNGESVTFTIRRVADQVQAQELTRLGDDAAGANSTLSTPARGRPQTDRLVSWAYVPFAKTLTQLQSKALPERWEFKDAAPDPSRPFPILHSYLLQTFGRLCLEDKVEVTANGSFAAFNTGLVDSRYESIYALFVPNVDSRVAWRFSSFCTAGEDRDGQNLVRHFDKLPEPAHYFQEPADLLYDTKTDPPELDWRHIIIERIDRYPREFVQEFWPSGIEHRDTASLTYDEGKQYWRAVGEAIEKQPRQYRSIMNRVGDAVDLSIKRVAWNFKTAVPMYYPKERALQVLLPLCLVSDNHPDLALVVEKTPSKRYLGHTVLSLDWAYKNARLVCRPDSDWLDAKQIAQSDERDESA